MRNGAHESDSISKQASILSIALLLCLGWLGLPPTWMLVTSSLLGIGVLWVRYRCPHCQGKGKLHAHDDILEKTFRGHTCYVCRGKGRISTAVSKSLIAAWKHEGQRRKKHEKTSSLEYRQQSFLMQWEQDDAAVQVYLQGNTEMIKRLSYEANQHRQANRAIYQRLYDEYLQACIQYELNLLDSIAEKTLDEQPALEYDEMC